MTLEFTDVGRIWLQALGRNATKKLAMADARKVIGEQVLAMNVPDGLNPEIRALLQRLNHMMSRMCLYRYNNVNMKLTDLAPEVLEMFAAVRDCFTYIAGHWDELPQTDYRKKGRWLRVQALYVEGMLGELLTGYGHALDIDGHINVLSDELTTIERMVADIETLLVGDQLAVHITSETNKALAHLRANITSTDGMDFTGRPC